MQIKDFIEKLRGLDEQNKKRIVWAIAIILAVIMVIFWFQISLNRLEKLGEESKNIKLPEEILK
jgi:hypothetical protein